MTDHVVPVPEWVCKRDGRLEPFDGDRICRSLFAATEQLGKPDAFTARELTDGVVHFLAAECEGQIPTTAQVAETIIKVVRELGHSGLSQAFAEAAQSRVKATPAARRLASGLERPAFAVDPMLDPRDREREAARSLMRQFALDQVFAPELVSAHEEGLLTLRGLDAPFELSACLLGPPRKSGLFEAIEAARRVAGARVAVDGPEHLLARSESPQSPEAFVRELRMGLCATGLSAVVALNSATAPPWAGDLADGPLFAGQRAPLSGERLTLIVDELLDALLSTGRVNVDWHLGERDFEAEPDRRLLGVVRRAAQGEPVVFAFDRPRRPVPLGEGIDRQHPAALMTVAVHLPRLADQLSQRGGLSASVFLDKLAPLARLALSAGVQKRAFLRGGGRGWPAFLLDRARLVVAPTGLAQVARRLTASTATDGPEALELSRRIVQRLAEVLEQDGRAVHLETCLDADHAADTGEIAGVSFWEPATPFRTQTRSSASLHGRPIAGTVIVALPEDPHDAVNELPGLLRWVWRQTDAARLRFVRPEAAHAQMTASW
jgi:hypothetical protein